MNRPEKCWQRWAPDFFPERPFHALQEIWHLKDLDYVTGLMPVWYFVCVSHECANYHDFKEREDLALFVTDLINLTEASYFLLKFKDKMLEQPGRNPEFVKKELARLPEGYWINVDQVKEPLPIITEFVKKYDRSYVRLELWHFFEGVSFYDGPLSREIRYPKDNQTQWLLLHCVTEAAYVIASGQYTDLDGTVVSSVAPACH